MAPEGSYQRRENVIKELLALNHGTQYSLSFRRPERIQFQMVAHYAGPHPNIKGAEKRWVGNLSRGG